MRPWRQEQREGGREVPFEKKKSVPLPVEEGPSSKGAGMDHSFICFIRMVPKQVQLLRNFERSHQVGLADFVHAVVAIDEIQERCGLHSNQVHIVAHHFPQALRLGQEAVSETLRIPELVTILYAHEGVLEIRQRARPLLDQPRKQGRVCLRMLPPIGY